MLTSEYTRPLTGRPYYRNAGIIKVYDRNNNRYSVGEIVFERYDDQNYQYIIKPYWNLIKSIPNGIGTSEKVPSFQKLRERDSPMARWR